jgi:hypothetical protein
MELLMTLAIVLACKTFLTPRPLAFEGSLVVMGSQMT